MTQLPNYRPEQRDAQAPQPGPQKNPQQTQENNGGPRGFGQPQAQNRMAQPGGRSPVQQAVAPMPQPGTGQPGNLYPPVPPNFQAQLWQSRNSLPPMDLITAAFSQLHGRQATPDEIQRLLSSSPNTDHLIEQLLNIQNPGNMAPLQQAINPNPLF